MQFEFSVCLQTYCTNQKLSVSRQFSETYAKTSYGSGWRKNVVTSYGSGWRKNAVTNHGSG